MHSLTTPTISGQAGPAERPSAVSRWSFGASLLAFIVAAAYIVALVVFHLSGLRPPGWASTAQRIVPALDLILAAVGVVLNVVETLRILARAQAYDPRETGKGLAVDDGAAILSRMRRGCVVRVAIPLAMVGALIALLVSVLPLPLLGHDSVQVHADNPLQSCTGSLVPFTFELDNAASTLDVSWSAQPVETLGGGTPWAQVQPAQGAVRAGHRVKVQVVPNLLVCQFLARAQPVANGQVNADVLLATDATYHVQVTSTGWTRQTTTLTMQISGGTPLPTPSATPTRTPRPTPRATATRSTPTSTPRSPTPTPRPITPHAALQVTQNRTYSESCTSAPASAYSVTLDNRDSNVPIDWQFSAAGGWASASPSSARIGARQMATVRVSPSVCPIGAVSTTYQATLHLGFPYGGSQPDIALSDTIAGPAPHPALEVTQNQNASSHCFLGETYTITIDNLSGNVPVMWQFIPTEYNGVSPWAFASPPSGTLAAGQGATVIALSTQEWMMCSVTYHATLHLTFPAGGFQNDIALTDTTLGS